jgi:hypothetical protein
MCKPLYLSSLCSQEDYSLVWGFVGGGVNIPQKKKFIFEGDSTGYLQRKIVARKPDKSIFRQTAWDRSIYIPQHTAAIDIKIKIDSRMSFLKLKFLHNPFIFFSHSNSSFLTSYLISNILFLLKA